MRDFSPSSPTSQPPGALLSGRPSAIHHGDRPSSPLSGATHQDSAVLLAGNWLLSAVLLLGTVLTGWLWWQSQQKLKQLQRENAKQGENLEQTSSTLQDYLNSSALRGSKILALDYLRMRLDEEVFHYQIIHQVEEKLTELVGSLVKSPLPEGGTTKQILLDRLIEIEYDLEGLEGKWYRCTVLQIHVQLRTLPIQSSSNTIKQMLEAVTLFITHPQGKAESKMPLQEQWLKLRWESSNQPLPLLNLQNYPANNRASQTLPANTMTNTAVASNISPPPQTEVFARMTP
ncbi:MAG: hypothetical protein ACO36E_12325 [Synechocystis sp.]